MAILEVKAARQWSTAQTAAAFQVTDATIASWMARLDDGELVKPNEPVNKYPDFARYIVQRLKILCPTMGKVKIAETLCRAGLHLCVTTAGRILKESPRQEPPAPQAEPKKKPKRVQSSKPNSAWLADITTVPTALGYWVAWLPFWVPLSWPFCHWIVVVVDHFSRRVMGMTGSRPGVRYEWHCQLLRNDLRPRPFLAPSHTFSVRLATLFSSGPAVRCDWATKN